MKGHIELRASAEALVHLTGLQTTVLIQIIVDQALARHETPRVNCTLNMYRTVLIAAAPIMANHKVAS